MAALEHQLNPTPRTESRGQRAVRRVQSILLWMQLTRNLAVRDVETRYKHSLLGLYWAIINPLVTAAIFSFLFGVVFHAVTGSIPYVVFLVTGLTFWNFFANGVMSATGCIAGSAGLLAKIYFPRVVLPTASVFARMIDLLFSLIVLVAVILIYRVPIHWSALWVIPLLGVQVIFTLGIAYLFASLNVLYRDMTQLVGLLLMVWMYMSPVMYATTTLNGTLQGILLMNPMGGMLQAMRDLIFVGHVTDMPFLWSAFAWSAFAFLAGLSVFKRIEPLFAEVM
ncbi:MAG: ABC transporter permease [Thermaerobacter sp.]|nr:ABC transporter permease [Thermaerobacter sp.]